MKTHRYSPSQKIALYLSATFLVAILNTGCGTIHGFGRDVKRTGEHIQAGSTSR